MKKPILFIVFNRPNVTKQVFNEIKKVEPSKLYIAADGPRKNIKGEPKKCEETRAIVEEIDWDCEVNTLFRDKNLGCKKAVSGAIDWLFENEEQGIILEDDCLPDKTFFRYCNELLEKYKDEERVMTIGGQNIQPQRRSENSYYFSKFMHCWGWATWRSAWKHYDVNMTSWPSAKENNRVLNEYFDDPQVIKYWEIMFDEAYSDNIDTWDYQWTYAIWENNGINILPEKNLVSNIGFGQNATHTKNENAHEANMPKGEMGFPLIHPSKLSINEKADSYTQSKKFNFPLHRYLLFNTIKFYKRIKKFIYESFTG